MTCRRKRRHSGSSHQQARPTQSHSVERSSAIPCRAKIWAWRYKGRKSPEWLIPLTPADQHPVGGGLEGEAEPEKPVEGGMRGAASVEPKDELVEVRLEVLLAQPVVDAQRPPLRVREHPVHPGQDQVGRRVADH